MSTGVGGCMRSLGGRNVELARIGLWTVVAGAALLQVFGALHRPVRQSQSDLIVYRGAVRLLLNGGSLYDFAAWNGAPFTYPPFAGLLFTPLALIAQVPLRMLWTAATLVVVILLAVLARSADGLRPIDPVLRVPAVATILFLSAPISSNLRFGQVSLLLVLLVLLDALSVTPARYRGVLTGVAAAVKLTPLIFVASWWVSGRRRLAVVAVGAFVACTALAWLILPDESLRFWFTEIFDVDRVGDLASGSNQSLNGALRRTGLTDIPRTVLTAAIGLPVLLVGLRRAARAARNGEPFAAAVIVGAAGLVISPVSWTHHQVWLVLAGLLALADRRRTIAWFVLVMIVMALPVTDLPSGIVTGNARLLLAVAVACVVPFAAVRVSPSGPSEKLTDGVRPADREAGAAGRAEPGWDRARRWQLRR